MVTTKYLTPAQRRILTRLADGLSTVEIAAECGTSETTVKRHLQVARFRLSTNSRVHAVATALRRGIIQ